MTVETALEKWSQIIRNIQKVTHGKPNLYKFKDFQGLELFGVFYSSTFKDIQVCKKPVSRDLLFWP